MGYDVLGKLFANRGYIGQLLFEHLFMTYIQLVTGIKRNLRNHLMSIVDKILLRKRSIIEIINDQLKNICQVEQFRPRSFTNFLSNLILSLSLILVGLKIKHKV